MKNNFVSLNPNPPKGFNYITPIKHDLLSGRVAIYSDSVEDASSLLDNFTERIQGIIITRSERFFLTALGPVLWHVGVPGPMIADLSGIAAGYLDMLSYGQSALNENEQLKLEFAHSKEIQSQLTENYNKNIQSLGKKVEQLREEMEKSRLAEEKLKQEITKHKLTVKDLRYSQTTLETVFNNSIPMCITSKDYEIIHANDSYYSVFSGPLDGKFKCYESRPGILCHTEKCPMKQILLGEEVVSLDSIKSDSMGNERHYIITARPFFNANEELEGIVESFQDITIHINAEKEKEELESKLLQSQKMKAIGTLAGGIAHDFNNMLSVIMGFSELALMKLTEDQPLYENLKNIHDSGTKASALTRQLLAFSRKQVLEMKTVELNLIINNLAKMLTRIIGEDIIFEIYTSAPVLDILADKSQIEQILMNLAVNARDAMQYGGKLLIKTKDAVIPHQRDLTMPPLKPGRYAVLTVKDNGCGMPEAVLDNVFEPFFTTKVSGEGTGLGLSTVYGIVNQHNGSITIESTVGKGTVFTIYLPISTKEVEESKEKKESILPHGTETILVVEDEAQVRKCTEKTLQVMGYKVMSASSGEEALAASDTYDGCIDVLLTDMVMPGMTGRILAQTLQFRRPSIKVIYITGYSEELVTEQCLMESDITLLQKPVSMTKLGVTLRNILDT